VKNCSDNNMRARDDASGSEFAMQVRHPARYQGIGEINRQVAEPHGQQCFVGSVLQVDGDASSGTS
jgi:hypothetical protein